MRGASREIWAERESDVSRRQDARATTILLLGRLLSGRGDGLCRIRNVSRGGLMIEAFGNFVEGETVEVELKAGDRLAGTVRWAEPGRLGMAFAQTVEVDQFL